MKAKWLGGAAWCSRPGCKYPRAFGHAQAATDGTPYIRLRGHRWRRDGRAGDLERYVLVDRSGRIVTTKLGRESRTRNLDMRAQLPIQARCECGAEQVIPVP